MHVQCVHELISNGFGNSIKAYLRATPFRLIRRKLKSKLTMFFVILGNMDILSDSLLNQMPYIEEFFYIHTYIHAYIHNWSLQSFSQHYWPSFSHHLCCVLFIAFLFTLRVFAINILRGNRRKNTFSTLFWCLACGLNACFTSNKSTHYTKNYGDFRRICLHTEKCTSILKYPQWSPDHWSIHNYLVNYSLIGVFNLHRAVRT